MTTSARNAAAAADAPTQPVPLQTQAMPLGALGVAVAATMPASLQLLVLGLDAAERCSVEAVVKLSRHGSPRLQLIDPVHAANADVVIVDGRDSRAMAWAARQLNLADKPVIWVDKDRGPYGHAYEQRPVAWVLLPLLLARAIEHHAALSRTPSQRGAAARAASHGTVLVVESDPAARIELAMLLRGSGVWVLEASDSAAAVDAVLEGGIACALVGLQSGPPPGAPEGLGACQRIKAVAPSLPVVMLGRHASGLDRTRASMNGAAAWVTLPSDAEHLCDVIDHAVATTRRKSLRV